MAFISPTGRGNDFYVERHMAAANAVDGWAFIAPRKCKLIGIRENHSVVGGASAAVRPRKVTADGVAPGAAAGATCVELTSATIDLTATVNTVQEPTLVTGTAVLFAKGDRLAEKYSGTQTGLAGCVIVYRFLAL